MKKVLALLLFVSVMFQYRNGDLNYDGKVTTTDLVIMRQMVSYNIRKTIVADLNYDYQVNELDLNILRHRLANE